MMMRNPEKIFKFQYDNTLSQDLDSLVRDNLEI